MADSNGPNQFNEDMLIERLHEVIDLSRTEQDISYVEVIGALEIVKLDLDAESRKSENEDEE